MARTVTVIGPRRRLTVAAQEDAAPAVVAAAVVLIAAGDRGGANAVIYRAVHEGIDAVALFEAISARAARSGGGDR